MEPNTASPAPRAAITAHLLTLCAVRRVEIMLSLRMARAGGRGDSPQAAELVAEQRVNDAALAELQGALQAAA